MTQLNVAPLVRLLVQLDNVGRKPFHILIDPRELTAVLFYNFGIALLLLGVDEQLLRELPCTILGKERHFGTSGVEPSVSRTFCYWVAASHIAAQEGQMCIICATQACRL